MAYWYVVKWEKKKKEIADQYNEYDPICVNSAPQIKLPGYDTVLLP